LLFIPNDLLFEHCGRVGEAGSSARLATKETREVRALLVWGALLLCPNAMFRYCYYFDMAVLDRYLLNHMALGAAGLEQFSTVGSVSCGH
jgi:hypothetical protein